ncbi:MAG: hypothetical protein QOI56_1040 [Actinomycetota bacterium]|nr:hypothetical protein [Actinomycetota bacterium]
MSDPRPSPCTESDSWGAELALGLLSGPERAAALSHLAACPACREQVDGLARIADRLLQLAPDAEPPAGFESRVLAAVGTAGGGSGRGAAGDVAVGSATPDAAPGAATPGDGGDQQGGGRAAGEIGDRPGGGGAAGEGGGGAAGEGGDRPGGHDRPGGGGAAGEGGGDARLAGGDVRARRRTSGRGSRRRGRTGALVAAVAVVAALSGGMVATALRSPSGGQPSALRTGLAVSASGRTSCRVVVSGSRPASVLVSLDGYPGGDTEVDVEMETASGAAVPLGPLSVTGGHGLLVRTLDIDAGALRLMRMLDHDGRVVYEAVLNDPPRS